LAISEGEGGGAQKGEKNHKTGKVDCKTSKVGEFFCEFRRKEGGFGPIRVVCSLSQREHHARRPEIKSIEDKKQR